MVMWCSTADRFLRVNDREVIVRSTPSRLELRGDQPGQFVDIVCLARAMTSYGPARTAVSETPASPGGRGYGGALPASVSIRMYAVIT